jgi:hypothetical protein
MKNPLNAREIQFELAKIDRYSFEPEQEETDKDRLIYLLSELKRVECLVTLELIRRAQ